MYKLVKIHVKKNIYFALRKEERISITIYFGTLFLGSWLFLLFYGIRFCHNPLQG